MLKKYLLPMCAVLTLACVSPAPPLLAAQSSASQTQSQDQPIVRDLKTLVAQNAEVKKALTDSLRNADWKNITTLDAYYAYVDGFARYIPAARSALDKIVEFYYLIDQSEALRNNAPFQAWVKRFAEAWGSFLDTPESIANLDTFYNSPIYAMEDYAAAPSGWRTFNQFFAREVKPGKRPVAAPCDDSVIVSPADSVYQGFWPIAPDMAIEAKGFKYSIEQLLEGSPYKDAFKGGVFTHSFLNVNDYHRFHTPVAGKLVEKRVIKGKMALDVTKNPATGELEPVDGTGYQFTQTRGLIVLQTETLGLVAVLPIGMAQVSSVNLTPDLRAELRKGEEFGYFLFGGSDIITLFQADKVRFTATPGTHYPQGQKIGEAVR